MSEVFTLEFSWFAIFVVLLTGFAILDGFDLGVGIFHLFSKSDEERRLMLNTIGPVWDGNEVWLVTAGGALFAGFPDVYATFCSAFYIPIMLLLSGLIFRAVAIEFRSKQPMAWWRWMWDLLFSAASLVIALGLGIVVGNLIVGIPLDHQKEFIGSFESLLHPYALLVGVLVVALFSMHGVIYVLMKTEGTLHDKMREWVNPAIILFIMLYAFTTVATLIYYPHMVEAIKERPFFLLVAFINMLAIANIPREIHHNRDGRAFLSSVLNIVCLMALFGIGTFPNAVRAVNDPVQLSMTIWNSASSHKTLAILHLIALIGIPMVLGYTIAIYYIFRGKVKLDSTSY
ncbi:cytochrome d ubiquinol oxidase subunit 2 [Waddlia chondrophila 2032/99]|uniref:Cytochrome d ubiquinol oxidase subunit 2 n=2 Tax=Waddlia chondrophila TaxID=71667 RepID=F8LCE0_9BACT|nr:cytochrome d ubiquinol oxidase subunit II [Waddlia chondrophila]ADI38153.1 putative cytochrome d ubiquinol oxidase subunit 2 [Waddlia chondrophila WSU 86-1044]CCB91154.1 cytochrome d ubiquinol oxidase subunit 2 [Waddlia chondrophila 2032/99]